MVGAGSVLKNRWKLLNKVGQGAFGEIYSGIDISSPESVAIKLERWDNKKAVLKMEVAVLKKLQHCIYTCKYVHCGHFESYNYLVMELLGENLSDLRRRRPGGRFSLLTTVRFVSILQRVCAKDLRSLHIQQRTLVFDHPNVLSCVINTDHFTTFSPLNFQTLRI